MNWDEETLVLIIWILCGIFIFLTWFPVVVARFGGTKLQYLPVKPIPEPDPLRSVVDYVYWADQIPAFGYEIVGEFPSYVRYHVPNWSLDFFSRVFQDPKRKTVVVLQRLPKPIGIWRSVQILTMLQDGTIIATYNFDVPDEDNQEYLRDGFSTFNFAEMEDFHQRRLVEARQQGRREDTEATVESILQSSLVQDQEIWKVGAKQLAGKYISVHAVIHTTISLPTVYALGILHWAIPTTNLVIAFVFLVGDHIQKSQTTALIRQAFDQAARPKRTGE